LARAIGGALLSNLSINPPGDDSNLREPFQMTARSTPACFQPKLLRIAGVMTA
jgi:hypothetical protein